MMGTKRNMPTTFSHIQSDEMGNIAAHGPVDLPDQ